MENTSGASCGKICEKVRSPKETGRHNLWRWHKHPAKGLHRNSPSHHGLSQTSLVTTLNAIKSKLDKVQNVILQAIVGAMKKKTPMKERREQTWSPWNSKEHLKVLTQTEKIRRLPSHPLYNKLASPTKKKKKKKAEKTEPQPFPRDIRRTHGDILDPQINEENLFCSWDWNQEDLWATISLEVPGLLPAEQ